MTDQVIECSSACTVTLQLVPPTATSDYYTSSGVIFGAIMTAAVLIWCARFVARLFSRSPEA